MILKHFFTSVFAQETGKNESDDGEKVAGKTEKSQVFSVTISETADELKVLIEEDIRKHLSTETGMDRLKDVFRREKSDVLSPQFKFAGETAINTGIITFLGTYFFGARMAGSKFIEKHTHKTFNTKFNAIRTFNDAMVFGGLRFGLRMGVKAGIFTWIFMFSSQLFSTYRNKTTLTDYVLAGGLTCGLLRMNLGVRGFIAGTTIGTFFGFFGGAALLGLMKLQGSTQEEVHHKGLYEKYALIRELGKTQKVNEIADDAVITNTVASTAEVA